MWKARDVRVMGIWLAAGVVLFGAIVTIAGAVAMYNHGIIADETGVSGWNPALWLVLLCGAALVLVGALQMAHAVRPSSGTSA